MAFDKGHALVIGVGTYPNAPALNNATLTAHDAEAVAAVLRDPQYCGYLIDRVHVLSDAKATRDQILAELKQLEAVQPDDTVFIFYSGHGEFGDDDGYYLTTYDTQLNNNKVVAGTGIREKELLDALKSIKAQRALLIFNACHSGAAAPDALGAPEVAGENVPDEVANAILGTGEGRVIITACRKDQKSYFSRKEATTLFAQVLADGLRGKDIRPRKNYIGVFDLYDYVYDTVRRAAQRRWDEVQQPEITISRGVGVGVMAVALYQGEAPQGKLGPDDRPATLGSPPREVEPEVSRRALEQLLTGKYNFAAGGNISDVEIVEGDKPQIDARGSQGFNYRPSGPITQVFGEQRNIDTGGGTYYEGADERRGIFGGEFSGSGPVIGSNEGVINVGDSSGAAARPPNPLRVALEHVRQAISQARQSNLPDLVADLESVQLYISQALDAENQGNASRRQTKLQQARNELQNLTAQTPGLQPLLDIVRQVA